MKKDDVERIANRLEKERRERELDAYEAAKLREYFKGETVVEYRDHVEILAYESVQQPLKADSTGGGLVMWQHDGKDAEGNHWRYFSLEYWREDGHHDMASTAGYIRIEHEQDQ